MFKMKVLIIKTLRILFYLQFLLLCSCATLYSGKSVQDVSCENLVFNNSTATFRFTRIIEKDSERYLILQSQTYSKESFQYVSSLNLFQHNEKIEFPYESVSLQSNNKLEEILLATIPKVKTKYFIDIYNISPFRPHGGGMGTWGGLLSALTLGVIPSWWHNQSTYIVKIFENGKQTSTLNFKEDYHAFHSTLFYLLPSSDKSLGSSLNNIEKNSIKKILKEIPTKEH